MYIRPTTDIYEAQEMREGLLRGLDTVARVVGQTFGPRGHTVIFQERNSYPRSTKDGVTVATSLWLKDPLENVAAQRAIESSIRVVREVGDGTTSVLILLQDFVKRGMAKLSSGHSYNQIKAAAETDLKVVLDELRAISQPVTTPEEVAFVGTISANQDQAIGGLFREAYEHVGRDGNILVTETEDTATTLEIVEGYQFDRGYVNGGFRTNPGRVAATYFATDTQFVRVLLVDGKLSTVDDVQALVDTKDSLVNQLALKGIPLLIVAEDISGPALQQLLNWHADPAMPLKVIPVRAPGYGEDRDEQLRDLAAFVGGKVVGQRAGVSLRGLKIGDLGTAQQISVTPDNTVILSGGGTAAGVQQRLELLQEKLAGVTGDFERGVLQQRIGRLRGVVAVIKVGGYSTTEKKERLDRIDDASCAVRAALSEGIVPGGGSALLWCWHHCQFSEGSLLKEILGLPFQRLTESVATPSKTSFVDLVLEEFTAKQHPWWGVNALTGEVGNPRELGVIDPTKVQRVVLETVVSIGLSLLSTAAVVTFQEVTQ